MKELLTMDFDALVAKEMPILQEILALRLAVSRTWDNVEIHTTKRYMDIKWCCPKKKDGSSQLKRVQPFNAENLLKEVWSQWGKLQVDIKQAQAK